MYYSYYVLHFAESLFVFGCEVASVANNRFFSAIVSTNSDGSNVQCCAC